MYPSPKIDLGPCVDEAKASVKVPFIRVDEAMADEAVAKGRRIGVIATLFTTLKPTADLIVQRAAIAGKQVEMETVLCQGAFEALGAGKTDVHDRVVKENLKGLMERVDVVVLAQASMARVADQFSPAERKAPILSSPRLGVLRLRGVLESLKQEA